MFMPSQVKPAHKKTVVKIRKGRNRELVLKRNDRIIIRYYFWREVQRRRSDDVIDILSQKEFFLNQSTLRRIIRDNLDKYSILRTEKPSAKKLETYSFTPPDPQQSLWLN